MGNLRKRMEGWLAGRTHLERDAEFTLLFLRIADECDLAIAQGKLSEPQEQFLFECVCNPHSLVWQNAAEHISILQGHGVTADSIVLALSKSKKGGVRFAALAILRDARTANAVVDEILIALLGDKSEKVCFSAAEVAAYYYRKRWLVPQLEIAAQKYPSIAKYLHLLRDGFFLQQVEDTRFSLKVMSDYNFGSEETLIDASELPNIPQIAEALRKKKSIVDSHKTPILIEETRQSPQGVTIS